MPKRTDYDKFKECMVMLRENGVIEKVNEDYVGINDDIIFDVFRGGFDVPFLTVVFDNDGNFDHEN